MDPNQPQQLDPSIVALAKAIGRTESGGNYNARGQSGESGAYQFMPQTWKAWAGKYLGDSNAQMTPENQDKVAYTHIAEEAKLGFKPAQIASRWNSGRADWRGNVGTNSQGVHFDTPAYVNKVAEAYDKNMAGIQTANASGGYNPNPYSNPSGGSSPGQFDLTGSGSSATTPTQASHTGSDQSWGGIIRGRTDQISQAIADSNSGKINPLSGVLQGVGAIGGAVGDATNKVLEYVVPGMKQVEDLIGQGVGSLASTAAGQSVMSEIQKFSTDHPELSADIGAGFNIATAIPILRGLGTVKNLAMDGVSLALKSVAEKSVAKDIAGVASRTIGGRKILATVPEAIDTMIKERAIPEIEGKIYTTQNAYKTLGKAISNVEDSELQPALARASTPEISSRIPLEDYRKLAIQTAQNELKDPSGIESAFDRIRLKYGDYPTLQQMNEAKRTIANNISEAGFNSPSYTTDKIVRKALQTGVEEGAAKLGLPDIQAINQKMSALIKAQDLLKFIDRRPVRNGGLMHELIKGASTAGGAAIGGMTGNPIVGGAIGYSASGYLESKLGRLMPKVVFQKALKRAGTGSVMDVLKTSANASKGKVGGLIGAALAQKAASGK